MRTFLDTVFNSANEAMGPADVFKESEQYYFSIVLVADERFKFTNKMPTVTMNGKEKYNCALHLYNSGGHPSCLIISSVISEPSEASPISSVEVSGIDIPVYGDHPDFTGVLPDGAPYHFADIDELKSLNVQSYGTSINGMWWKEGTRDMSSEDVFNRTDLTYSFSFFLIPDEGYKFVSGSEIKLKLNGTEISSTGENVVVLPNYILIISEDFKVDLKTIDSAEVSGIDIPVYGEHPDFTGVLPDGAPYHFADIDELKSLKVQSYGTSINGMWWKEGTRDMSSEDVFNRADLTYSFSFFLIPDKGYKFAGDSEIKLKLNGTEISSTGENVVVLPNYILIISKDFKIEAPKLIYSAEVNDIDIPVYGEHPDFTGVLPDGADYHLASREEIENLNNDFSMYANTNINGIWWVEGKRDMSETDIFDKPGTDYHFDLLLIPNDGYEFSGNITVKLNSSELTEIYNYNVQPNFVYICSDYFLIKEPHVHDFGTDWNSDETEHWHECECGERSDFAEHDLKWVTDREPTASEPGSKHQECSVCGYRGPDIEIPPTGEIPDTGSDTVIMISASFAVLFLTGSLAIAGKRRKKH